MSEVYTIPTSTLAWHTVINFYGELHDSTYMRENKKWNRYVYITLGKP